MSTMSDNETYNGYANRETWAFNLHWQNDQGLYNRTLDDARNHLEFTNPEASDRELGAVAVNLWFDTISTWTEETGQPLPENLRMMRDEVGSWWRVNHSEVGAAVRESLGEEGQA